jgi:solute carrier family 13 (sodium-dependent dicarboxylate transporter), member 2/3/5
MDTSTQAIADRDNRQAEARGQAWISLGVAVAAAVSILLATTWSGAALERPARLTLAIFVAMATLWAWGAIPPFAVGMVGLTALVISCSYPWEGPGQAVPWEQFAAQFTTTPMVLTLAGMALAVGASQSGIDRVLAMRLLGPVLDQPKKLALILLLLGAGFSMVISNTATATLLLTIVMPLVRPLGFASRSARAMILAATLGAAVGGLATPIGTTPNLIALGKLLDSGIEISFFGWVVRGAPIAAVAVATAYLLLLRLGGGFADWQVPQRSGERAYLNRQGYWWIAAMMVTLLLWGTQPWTGIPLAVSSLFPLAFLPACGVLSAESMRKIDWATLLLMGSGLCLGLATQQTGLAAWIVDRLIPGQAPLAVITVVFCVLAIFLSTFMSNTATANLLIPLALALPGQQAMLQCTLAVALGCSLAVSLPISTPPALLAYSTGLLDTRELLRIGVLIGVAGSIATLAVLLLSV